MKLRVEISDDIDCDEVVIRSKRIDSNVMKLREAIEDVLSASEIELKLGDRDYFVPVSDILFFETDGGKLSVHTKDRIYSSDEKLYSLEERLPRSFVRVSKSCVVNSANVEVISRSVTGSAEVGFFGSDKRAYVSRMYYKILKEIIYETRLSK